MLFICQEPLILDKEKHHLISESINVAYPISDTGVPNMNPNEAMLLQDPSQKGH